VLLTGKFTGRSPSDRFIVRDASTEPHIDWGARNLALSPNHALALAEHLRSHLEGRELFEVRAHASGARGVGVRLITTSPAHALFARHLFQTERTATDGDPITVLHGPECLANPEEHGTSSGTFVVLSPSERAIWIGGTGYAGEIKKAVFSLLNYLLPDSGVLPMHAAVNVGRHGDSAVFFGLSGTGKTSLSADPERFLLGDDEHGWSEEGLFNLEGGCYAKTIGLRRENEPDIWSAVHQPLVLLENVVADAAGRVDWDDTSITENTRAAYPLSALPRVWPRELASSPKNVVFLTADAFGVLPAVARLSIDQAVYYFLSGYTAKLAGTELGSLQPQPTFSTCFGSPFMPRPPTLYADMLRQRVEQAGARVWLLNTGWIDGPYGEGRRIPIAETRRMLSAILRGDLDTAPTRTDPFFGVQVPAQIPGVSLRTLDPRASWGDGTRYDEQAATLARRFHENFERYAASVPSAVVRAGPLRS